MAVTCHSPGPSGLAAALRFAAEGGDPGKFIVAHCDDNGIELNTKIAAAGSWVSIDGIGRKPEADHVAIVLPLLQKSPDRLLLSMDSGWYNVGEADGGKINGFTALTDRFLPALRKAGVSDAQIKHVTTQTRRASSRRRRNGASYPGLGIGLGCACCDWPDVGTGRVPGQAEESRQASLDSPSQY